MQEICKHVDGMRRCAEGQDEGKGDINSDHVRCVHIEIVVVSSIVNEIMKGVECDSIKEVDEEARPPFGLLSDAELFDEPELEGCGFEFTVGVFLQEEDNVPVVETVGADRSAIRRRASQCSSSHVTPSPLVESGSSQPVAVLTASSSRSLSSPPASQMENPLRPSDLMKDPLEVKARGESKETATPVLGLYT